MRNSAASPKWYTLVHYKIEQPRAVGEETVWEKGRDGAGRAAARQAARSTAARSASTKPQSGPRPPQRDLLAYCSEVFLLDELDSTASCKMGNPDDDLLARFAALKGVPDRAVVPPVSADLTAASGKLDDDADVSVPPAQG